MRLLVPKILEYIMLSLNIELIILFLVNIISHLVNIPFKLTSYFDSSIKQLKQCTVAVFEEIKKTGEFTVQFKIKRDLHVSPNNNTN